MEGNTTPPASGWKQKATLFGYEALCAVLKLCDIRLVALFGRCIGYLVWMAIPSRRRIVARNLRIVIDPTLRKKQLASMVRRNMVRTTMNLFCSLKTGLLTDKEEAKAIRIKGIETFEQDGIGDKTSIACIPHAGNWEILARIRPHFSHVAHYGSMYRKLSNPLLEEYVYRCRTSHGCEMFSKEDGLKGVLKMARNGGLLGILSDQFTQEGLFLPYFGKVTGVTPLPALLYKRSKGKATLYAVFTRNTGLGRWDAVMDHAVELPDGDPDLPTISQHVNLALERCQKENILDGFWMHHRWKSTRAFAPEQPDGVEEVAAQHIKLPFRIIVCMPEAFEEAAILLPVLRVLKACRFDAQLTVICPTEQSKLWAQQPEVTNVVTTDGGSTPMEQLESDELYKDGPYDILFMFSENKKVMKNLQGLMPVYTSTFAENPLTRKFRFRTKFTTAHTGPPIHRLQDYAHLLTREHKLKFRTDTSPSRHNPQAKGCFISPFSTLGEADSWPEERWAELCARLQGAVTLLALKADADKAAAMAERLGIPCRAVEAHEVSDVLGPGAKLYAVDGLLPQLAAMAGCPCNVLMASRLSERYAPLGKGHRTVFNHMPCHPCYQSGCDMQPHCTEAVSVDDMLAQKKS